MMFHFRKRISLEMIEKVNESLVAGLRDNDNPPSDDDPPDANLSVTAEKPETENSASTKNTNNNGRLILDATCTPADITYPTDSKLLNDAREKSETLVDLLYAQCTQAKIKPRTYRKIARKKWLSLSQPHTPDSTQ